MSPLEHLFSQGTIERVGWMLVHFLWQATAVALLLGLLLRLLRRAGANLRHTVACGALVLLVALPLVTMQFVEISGPPAEASPLLSNPLPTVPAPSLVPVQTVEELAPPASAAPPEMADLTVAIPWHEKLATALEPALPYFVVGWLAGVFGLSAWHLGGWAQLHRLKRRMACKAGASLHATLDELAGRLGVRRAVTLLESAVIEVPTVVGWLRPVILVPTSALTGLAPDQVRAILAHELAHIRRYDCLANLLQTVVEILGFYHPAVWWVSHCIRVERENCCDDLAVHICGDSLRYARALTSMETLRHSRTDLAMAATGGSLTARITRLLGRSTPRSRPFAWLPALVALLLTAGLIVSTALALARPSTVPPAENVDSNSNAVETDPVRDSEPANPNPATKLAVGRGNEGSKDEEKATVQVDFIIASILSEAEIDRETRLLIGDILSREDPQIAGEIVGPGRAKTLGEVLRRYVAGRSLSQDTREALLGLLRRRGLVRIDARPCVTVRDREEASLKIVRDESFLAPTPGDPNAAASTEPIHIEYGTRVQVTPSIQNGRQIRLETAVTLTDPGPEAEESLLPTVRTTAIESTVTVPENRCFSLLLRPGGRDNTSSATSESMLVLFLQPTIATASPESSDRSGAHAVPMAKQVLLEVHTIAATREDLAEIGVEWPPPSSPVGSPVPSAGMQIGYSTVTKSLDAALRRLHEQGRAEILSNHQLVAFDGRQSRIKAVTEKWFAVGDPSEDASPERPAFTKVDSGTILSATPHIGDNNITLEIALETSDTLPKAGGGDLPVVTRRATRNVVTIQAGDTVVLAGLEPAANAANSDSAKSCVILITVHSMSQTGGITIQPGTDLLDALMQIGVHFGVRISADATVKPRPIQARSVAATTETAIREILAGTPYTFERVAEPGHPSYRVYRPFTGRFEGRALREILQHISSVVEVPIITDATVQGEIFAHLENVRLETALQIVLAGTPYVFERMPGCYLVTQVHALAGELP